MKIVSIVADDAPSAIARVERELGPEAVVVSVRKLPAQGLSRLWKNHGAVEVMAAMPEEPKEAQELKGPKPRHVIPENQDEYAPFRDKIEVESPITPHPRRWKSITWLESMGLMHAFAEKLERQIALTHGEVPPEAPIAEWNLVRNTLARAWRPARKTMEGTGRPHVFIGPAGSGKTTVLCKWMTASVLREEHKVHVWRLDGDTANSSEFLSLHCEMIGVPVERFWCGPEGEPDLLFIDLPGVEVGNANAMEALRAQIAALPDPHVHLVLNAAYECSVLFEQFQAFKVFSPEDVIFTHLDEERRRVKLWNFILGTNCSVSFLGAGQKIPGDFFRAESTLLFPSEFRP